MYPQVDDEIVQIICARISEEFKVNVILKYLSVSEDERNLRDKHEKYYDEFIKSLYTYNQPSAIRNFMDSIGLTEEDLESKEGKERFVKELIIRKDGESVWYNIYTGINDQYDANYQISQIKKECQAYLRDRNKIIGILAVTGKDIYSGEENNNFLFGLASGNVAVMSLHRFYAQSAPFATVVKRAVRQEFASAGHIIGIPRCSTPQCARSYPHSLAEQDQKEDRLFAECIDNLNQRYQELLN